MSVDLNTINVVAYPKREKTVDYGAELAKGLEALGYVIVLEGDTLSVSPPETPDDSENLDIDEEVIEEVQTSNSGTKLSDILKEDSENKLTAMKAQNSILENQNKHINKTNELIAKQTLAIGEQTKATLALVTALSSISSSFASSVDISKNKVNLDIEKANLQAKNNDLLDKQEVSTTVNVDTSALASENAKLNKELQKHTKEIAKANTTLADVAQLQKEDIEFNKQTSSKLKDLEGNSISPREAKALKDNEIGKSVKQENETDYLKWTLDLLSDVAGVEDEETDEEKNIFSLALEPFKDIDITKIEQLDNQMKGKTDV